jgi:phosphopantetheinyl transferase
MNVIDDIHWIPISSMNEVSILEHSFIDIYFLSTVSIKEMLAQTHLLSAAELEYCNSFYKETDQQLKKLGKIATRIILAAYNKSLPQDLVIKRNIYSKPYCSNKNQFSFNLSDSGNTILLVVSSNEVGVDIEVHNPSFIYTDILADFFSLSEIQTVTTAADPLKAFYSIWVSKESLLKAIGTGFGTLDVKEQGWDTSIYQNSDYSIGITARSGNYTLRFFKYLAIKT